MSKEWLKKEFGKEEGFKNVIVSKEMAEKWLNVNTHNRPLSERRINTYALMMLSGLWVTSNDSILFFDDGSLGNGQHRLFGLIEAAQSKPDIKIPLSVMWGIPKKEGKCQNIMDFIDRGRGRSAAHNWELSHNYKLRERGLLSTNIGAITNLFGRVFSGGSRQHLESPEIDLIYHLYKTEIDAVLLANKSVRKISKAPVWTALVFAGKIDLNKTLEFEDKLFSGDGIHVGEPVMTLRNKLFSNHIIEGGSRTSTFKDTLTALSYFFRGQRLSKIYTTENGFDFFASGQMNIINKITKAITFKEVD